ncbi:MAG: hypothetical protein ACREQO_21660 [Candidatus Binatia bacterium]
MTTSPAAVIQLLATVPGDHGGFDRRARSYFYQLWATTHRHWLTFAGLTLAGLICAARATKKGQRPQIDARRNAEALVW